MKIFFSITFLLLSVVLSVTVARPPERQVATTTVSTNSEDTPTIAGGYLLDDKHKLVAGDKVSFQILEDKNPVKTLSVTDSGELNVPYIGRVVVANKTCKQVAQELKGPLEREYYFRATVIIGLDVVNKVLGKVYLVGQVRVQGPIDIPSEESFTVGKAILCAGGMGDFADKKNVSLVRTGKNGKKITFQLNLVDILEKGEMEKDMALQNGDFIIVPTKLINF